MNALSEVSEGCVKALVEKLPVEDVWTLDCNTARECGLDSDPNFIVIVPDRENALQLEAEAVELLHHDFPAEKTGVFVFPQSAIERSPHPLLVKMALTSGRRVFGQ